MIFDLNISNGFLNYIILFFDVLFGIILAFFINNYIESISVKKKLRSILLDFKQKISDDIKFKSIFRGFNRKRKLLIIF